jgi:tRNA (cytidine/uridine-2'-O-)-methyltransferase
MHLALYQPDIAPNAGTMARLCACLGVALHVIEPCGFPFSAASFRRAAMDYLAHADIQGHLSWERFLAARPGGRLILLSSRAHTPYYKVSYRPDDVLLVGRETAGVPDEVRTTCDLSVAIPLQPGLRSINAATAAAMVLGEALRQTASFPGA